MEYPDPNSVRAPEDPHTIPSSGLPLRSPGPPKALTARRVSKIGLEHRQSSLFDNRDRVLIYDLDRLS